MANLIDRERVLSEVRAIVVETLRLEEAAVRPESSCVADLGAESLDFLDVNYQIEQVFGIKMARHFLLEHAEELFGEGTTIDDRGRVTAGGIDLLRQRYGPAAGLDTAERLDIDAVASLITVGAIADTVVDILSTLPDHCDCGAAAWSSDDGTHVICRECREPARYADGDERTRQWLAEREPA